jgi:hypothetical protein
MGWKSISPLPSSFSAPFISRMILESIPEETAKAIRLGIFALMDPVMMFGRGPLGSNNQMDPSGSS